jgi:hypothetical protein
VVRCRKIIGGNGSTQQREFAIKVIKNKPAYQNQARKEIINLRILNEEEHKLGQHRIVRLLDFFIYR